MSWMSPAWPPRATHRRSPIQIAATMPRMIASAYARTGNGPTCHTPEEGLGIESTVVSRVIPSVLVQQVVDVGGEVCGGGLLAPVDRAVVGGVDAGDGGAVGDLV